MRKFKQVLVTDTIQEMHGILAGYGDEGYEAISMHIHEYDDDTSKEWVTVLFKKETEEIPSMGSLIVRKNNILPFVGGSGTNVCRTMEPMPDEEYVNGV